MPTAQPSKNLLPAASLGTRLPYVATQLLGSLGATETTLTPRSVKRMQKSFPIPIEQEILWADVAFGTRPHGLVLTDVGIFLKDGPSDEDDEDQEPAQTTEGSLELDGCGYHYLRWENFDPALISRVDGRPTIGGVPFMDVARFRRIANGCVRINNVRVRMRKAGRRLTSGVLDNSTPIRSVCRKTAADTFDWCFDEDGFYRFFSDYPSSQNPPADSDPDELAPWYVEVPADQYDAILQRMRKKIERGKVPGIEDPDAAGSLVRCSDFTRLQAVNLARTGSIPQVIYKSSTGSVVCKSPKGLSSQLHQWLSLRERLGLHLSNPDGSAPMPGQFSANQIAEAIAAGANTQVDPERAAQASTASFVASNAASTAGRTVGATGARLLLSAVGVASGPLAMVASLALGEACEKAGSEAFAMARDMFFEPEARIWGRLFEGVLANVVFEYALTEGEQDVLAELMSRMGPALFQRLGIALKQSQCQEQEIRTLLVPMCEAIRRA